MRSCRRLNARNIVFRVIEERRGKKEKKREKKGVKKCIRRYPDYSIHGQSPAFRSDSHDRGMKKRSWKVFRPIVFSFFPTRSEERSTSRFSFSVRCFARETSEIHRLLRMKFDLELRGNYFLSFLFRNDFPTGFKTVLFPFEKKFKKRFDLFDRYPFLRNIAKISYPDFQSRKFIEKFFPTESLRVEIERYGNYIHKTHGYYREDL